MAILVLHEDADRAEVHLPFSQKLLAQTKDHGLNVTLGLGYGATERMAYLTYKQTIVLGDVGVETHGTKRREEEVLLLDTRRFALACHEGTKERHDNTVMRQEKMLNMVG